MDFLSFAFAALIIGFWVVPPILNNSHEHEEKMACIQHPESPICKKYVEGK